MSDAFDSVEMADSAIELIAFFGRQITWRKIIVTENELDPSEPTQTNEDHFVTVAFLTPKREGRESLVNSENEQRKLNKRLYMGGQSFEPNGKDVLIFDDQQWRIRNWKETNPAGTPILYEIEIER